MSRFKCTNIDCSSFDKEIIVDRIKWIFNESIKKLVLSEPMICKECGSELQVIKNETIPEICINKFDSLSPQQKREVIKRRSSEHMRKTGEEKEILERKRANIEANKKMFK